MSIRILASLALVIVAGASVRLDAWGVQGHRLVALVAGARLTPAARANVEWLLPDTTLAEVASWADDHRTDHRATGPWHFVNLPFEAIRYERDRDCPRQPGVAAGSRGDRWRDCVVDRILYNQQRLADTSADRADRAIALKFLVHFVADLHQPFHAIVTARGGNNIPVIAFGSPECRSSVGAAYPCQLHGVWDSGLLAHRELSDAQYVAELSRQITANGWDTQPAGTPDGWAIESHGLAKAALLPAKGEVNEAYYRAHLPVVERRLARAGLRLAAVLNQSLPRLPRR
jgi:hypothetical protein